jgi:hypothetical protein
MEKRALSSGTGVCGPPRYQYFFLSRRTAKIQKPTQVEENSAFPAQPAVPPPAQQKPPLPLLQERDTC